MLFASPLLFLLFTLIPAATISTPVLERSDGAAKVISTDRVEELPTTLFQRVMATVHGVDKSVRTQLDHFAQDQSYFSEAVEVLAGQSGLIRNGADIINDILIKNFHKLSDISFSDSNKATIRAISENMLNKIDDMFEVTSSMDAYKRVDDATCRYLVALSQVTRDSVVNEQYKQNLLKFPLEQYRLQLTNRFLRGDYKSQDICGPLLF